MQQVFHFYKRDGQAIRPYSLVVDQKGVIQNEYFADLPPDSLSEETQTVQAFFDPTLPCPFSELLHLDTSYRAELNDLIQTQQDTPANRERLMRHYLPRVKQKAQGLPDTPPAVDPNKVYRTAFRPSNVPPPMTPAAESRMRDIKRFHNENEPCFFPGCEDLRRQMREAIEEAGGVDCPGCTKNQIMAQYGQHAIRAIEENKESAK